MIEQLEGQLTIFDVFDPDLWCGKMSPEHSVATTVKTSESSLKKPQKSQTRMPLYLDLTKENGHQADALWETGGVLLGVYTMHSFGEKPSEMSIREMCLHWGHRSAAEESRLSQILVGGSAPEILFERKSLSGDSEPISETRERTSALTEEDIRNSISFQERAGCAGGGKGLLIQNERTGALSTLQNQYVLPKVYGVDCYNQTQTEEVSKSLNSIATDSDHIPCVYGVNLYNGAVKGDKATTSTTNTNSTGSNPTVINIETEVEVRKYPVDKERLIDCLQAHKNKSIKEIADALQKPKTLVEHWFRKDSYFAIPDADIWFELKEMLGIDTDEFDESIMTFETKPGNFDMQNRIYVGETSPTITANQNHFHWVDDKSTMCIGNGQLHDALSPSVEVCKTLNCMDDPMKIVTYENNIHLMDAFQHHGYRESETVGTLTAGQNNGIRGDTPLVIADQHTFSQDSYDQLSANDVSASLKADGGNYGGAAKHW